jgi:hypothetical protein
MRLLEEFLHMCQVDICPCGSCMLHMLTSVQNVDVDTSMMMWHPVIVHCAVMDPNVVTQNPKKNITDPNVGRYG